ncbi:MAG: FHA domain-containing protein [Bacteroidales bacterium]|nr:FHA domain-containing protein [Bacteroidales bacterium]
METNSYKYFLNDSGSANGTFLNNELIQKNIPTLLHFGSKLRAGKTEFLLEKIDMDRTEIA